MNSDKLKNRELFYTYDHEWIDFQGSVAYIGICSFKLTGFKAIQEIAFNNSTGFKKQGEVIATLRYNDYVVEAHMPVDGNLVEINGTLLSGGGDEILQNPENSGWIALIVPSKPTERKDLLLSEQYQQTNLSKFV